MFTKSIHTFHLFKINIITLPRGWTDHVASVFQYIEAAPISQLAYIFTNNMNIFDSHNSFK